MSAFQIVTVVALLSVVLTLWTIKGTLERIAGSMDKMLKNHAREHGEKDGNFRRIADRVSVIFNLLNDETGWSQKWKAKFDEMRAKDQHEYDAKYGERDKLNEEWAKLYNDGTTNLDFDDWLKARKPTG